MPKNKCPLCVGEGDSRLKEMRSWGLCDKHYHRQRGMRSVGLCPECKRQEVIFALGVCRRCWLKLYQLGKTENPFGVPKYDPRNIEVHLSVRLAERLKVACNKCRLPREDFILEAIDVACVPRQIEAEILDHLEGKRVKNSAG